MRMLPVLILVLSVVNTLSRVKLVPHCSMDEFLGIIEDLKYNCIMRYTPILRVRSVINIRPHTPHPPSFK